MRRKSLRRGDTAAILKELGYPQDLPPVPAKARTLEALTALPKTAGDWSDAAAYVRQAGIGAVLKSKAHWGVGVGRDEKTGGPAVVFLTRGKVKRSGAKRTLREIAVVGKRAFPVREMELSPDAFGFQYGPMPLVRNIGASGFTGCAISNDPNSSDGGTFTGIFTSLAGHSQRGVTCAHVALGLGIKKLLNNLPSSLGTLFRSPAGEKLIVSGGPNIGQPMFQLFVTDTPWPILTFVPFSLATGVLTFLFLDVAAGPVRPTAIPGGQPPPTGLPDSKTTIFGARLSPGGLPTPGEPVYKIGQTTGVTWGTCLLSSFFIPIAIPLLPVIVLFVLNVHELALAPGDSGCLVTGNPGQQAYDMDGIGLGGTATSGPKSINKISMGVPFAVAGVFGNFRG
jgi:hypothetical protein